ncbi:MAG TPA: glycosyltransferase family 2 protein [Candidatus Saccharibacteria bacterium]|jgi:glycosyltransferase involved in cell wall biosynthesis|nr:glycosyltransferase family 2 protein [Candidatus Saccharibacteria bacterium]
MTLSIVIPVYNEERQIKGCLEEIARQTVKPDEVIVVDNNCRDKTVSIAKSFPFVTVITESKQGRGHARSAGFDVARSDIIGRIDADSRLDSHWVERVKSAFEQDSSLAGMTGIGVTSILPGMRWPRATIFSRSYYWFVHANFHTITMWGATMAISKKAWQSVADKVCNDDTVVHEDQDVSLWIAAQGGKIIQDNSVRITTSGQTYRYLPKILHYRRLFISTHRLHTTNGNLSSSKIHRLSYWSTFPGWVWSLFLGMLLIIVSAILFPVDYFITFILKKPEWLA